MLILKLAAIFRGWEGRTSLIYRPRGSRPRGPRATRPRPSGSGGARPDGRWPTALNQRAHGASGESHEPSSKLRPRRLSQLQDDVVAAPKVHKLSALRAALGTENAAEPNLGPCVRSRDCS